MNTEVYPRKELTIELTRKKADSVGTTAVYCIVFMNTSSGEKESDLCVKLLCAFILIGRQAIPS